MPRRESVTRSPFLGKRRSECDRAVKVRVTAATEVILCPGFVAVATCEFGEMVVHLTQPSGMRRLVDVFDAPLQFLTRSLPLAKKSRNIGIDDAGDPVHDENIAPR